MPSLSISRVTFCVGAASLLLSVCGSRAEVRVVTGRQTDETGGAFVFDRVPAPARDDLAAAGRWILADGQPDRNGGDLSRVHDGWVPAEADEPGENFFFGAGTEGGRLVVDLGQVVAVRQVNTYSWHPGSRGPQVYDLYAADGTSEGFDPAPKRGADPSGCGWTRLISVDTREPGRDEGGQYGASVSDSQGALGRFRYLLFAIVRTEDRDAFGNTFFSEIDVVGMDGTTQPATTRPREGRKTYDLEGGEYRIVVDTSETPDLAEWVERELVPVMKTWYPKLVALLPSEGYRAPRSVTVVIRADMRGVAATGGTRVSVAAAWFRANLEGEAKGAIVHELVHVVQQYGLARRSNPNPTRSPGWLVEGLADYLRWFRYEPESKGAEIAPDRAARARYDAGYRVSANFLNWVVENYGEDVVRELNAAMREGRYADDLWPRLTGRSLTELGEAWKANLEAPRSSP